MLPTMATEFIIKQFNENRILELQWSIQKEI